MKIKAKKSWPRKKVKKLERALQYGLEIFDLSKSVKVKLCGPRENDYGLCLSKSNSHLIVLYPHKSTISTLFHELRHAWQDENEGLEIFSTGGYYRSFEYSLDLENFDEYWNAPWEIDARKWEKLIFSAYKRNVPAKWVKKLILAQNAAKKLEQKVLFGVDF